jgi:hypothetical protein
MRLFKAISTSLFFALAACGQAAAPSEAEAQTAATAQNGEVTAAERAAILAAFSLRANARGLVQNECGDMITPQFTAEDLGPGPGRVVAFIMTGGPSAAACYGDGPLVTLVRYDGGGWREIYMVRGGMVIVLPARHNNGNDVAAGGPGFSFPVSHWNGTSYVATGRTVSDSAIGNARFIPNG